MRFIKPGRPKNRKRLDLHLLSTWGPVHLKHLTPDSRAADPVSV